MAKLCAHGAELARYARVSASGQSRMILAMMTDGYMLTRIDVMIDGRSSTGRWKRGKKFADTVPVAAMPPTLDTNLATLGFRRLPAGGR